MKKAKEVAVLLGVGGIGVACIRRVSYGRHVVVANRSLDHAEEVAKELRSSGFEVTTVRTDLSSKDDILNLVRVAQEIGPIARVINAAGVSPSQAPVEKILEVDLYGTAVFLEEFGKVIAPGGSGIVISSQSGHRLGPISQEDNDILATTPTEELLKLEMLKSIDNTLVAYQYAKRCNVLRVASEAIKWGKRGARLNSISPGIIITPLANDELNGPRGENYRKMLEAAPAGRAGATDEVGDLCEYLMSDKAQFITGADFLIDGGATASYWYGDLQYMRKEMGN